MAAGKKQKNAVKVVSEQTDSPLNEKQAGTN